MISSWKSFPVWGTSPTRIYFQLSTSKFLLFPPFQHFKYFALPHFLNFHNGLSGFAGIPQTRTTGLPRVPCRCTRRFVLVVKCTCYMCLNLSSITPSNFKPETELDRGQIGRGNSWLSVLATVCYFVPYFFWFSQTRELSLRDDWAQKVASKSDCV